jgi:hypothetical protein
MPSRTASRLFLLLSFILYAACLTREAFCVAGSCSDWPAWSILLFGVLGGHISWFANPLLIACWLAALFGRRLAAIILGLAALGLAVSFQFETTVITNEAGIANPITGLKEGYWLWLASMVTACIAAVFSCKAPPSS